MKDFSVGYYKKIMNRYLKNLNKIEFVVTYACTGRCKHCSEGDHAPHAERIDPEIAAYAVQRSRRYTRVIWK